MRTTYTIRKEPRYFHLNPSGYAQDARILPCRFLYIGTESLHFELLKEELGEGACFTSLHGAIDAWKKCSRATWEVSEIYIDLGNWTGEQVRQIRELRKMDKTRKLLVIANARDLEPAARKAMQATGLLDELVDFRVETALLPDKIEFLRKCLAASRDGERKRVAMQLGQQLGDFNLVRRFFDVLTASLLMLGLLPVLAVIALAVMLESKGPVFCGVYRAGRGYRIFKLWTFRTMRVGADRMLQSIAYLNMYNNFGHSPHCFSGGSDPRMTRVGRFLRRTGLDNLPSLWNVILGDMSLVGNRPLPLHEASALTEDRWVERFMAPSGLTGLWVLAGGRPGLSALEEKLKADLRYARHPGLLMDLKIIVMTILTRVKSWCKGPGGEWALRSTVVEADRRHGRWPEIPENEWVLGD